MAFIDIEIARLKINKSNDRHGELDNETAAIAELFRLRETHMRNLAADIVNERGVYDPPLVMLEAQEYVIYDGNRRVTCLKLIENPQRAPTQDLQEFFRGLRQRWEGDLPLTITCQVEDDRDIVDAILFRRHTGSQSGVGQSDWDDRAKRNFVERTGRGGRVDVAVEVESILQQAGRMPARQIPRSTLNRLLSSEANRERVGVSVAGNRFRITHNEPAVIDALARIADDLSSREVVLGDLWNNEGKRAYLNRLEDTGILPREDDLLPIDQGAGPNQRPPRRGGRPPVRRQPTTFIPVDAPNIPWRGNQARSRAIWDELQSLSLAQFPNAISALARILLELSVDGYLQSRALFNEQSNLSQKVRAATSDLMQRNIIDQAYFDEVDRMRQHDELISIRSMQRYVHSAHFAPLPRELETYWVRLGPLYVACLTH